MNKKDEDNSTEEGVGYIGCLRDEGVGRCVASRVKGATSRKNVTESFVKNNLDEGTAERKKGGKLYRNPLSLLRM